ncbi:hypothetical protein CTEN210_16640 [Chaetoceros tenuissimus]|uniref:Uncharacterized protein n=1 Tax=Chaetoceros tenuissimus TaxID=426638 RepID=A0AAD3DCK5_9STRA|nr:hypothetical protein CTEN210_16640 [Chaetoceros tenuissimus]
MMNSKRYILLHLLMLSYTDAFYTSLPAAFVPTFNTKLIVKVPEYQTKGVCSTSLMSSIGGNNNDDQDPDDEGLGDFLDPKKAFAESENLKKAREKLSEDALPINFGEDPPENENTNQKSGELLSPSDITFLQSNPYLNVVAKLSPSDLISKFTSTAHPRVQDAVRTTILGLIGTLPKMAFETTTITTGERLASLMFQLQMTGYMFKNAEYRLSLSQSLGIDGDNTALSLDDDEDNLSSGKVKGKIKVRYDTKNLSKPISDKNDDDASDSDEEEPSSLEVEVDAAAYMAELRNEVSKLKEDLSSTRQAKEDAIRKDLLLYIKTLPKQELNTLTNTMSNDVLGAMKGLVNVVMSGIGEGQITADTITEQSGEAMAQLCMWQLVVGYNLRELEVREEMKNALSSAAVQDESEDEDSDDSNIDFKSGGFE